MIFFKAFFLMSMLKVLDATRGRYLLCACLYAAALFTNGLMFELAFGATWSSVLLATALAWAGCALTFYLLHQFEGTPLYWVTLIVGFGVLLVLI